MLTASQINALKTKVKSEMARRGYYGSLSKFSGSDYDFISKPVSGGPILTEHGKKIIEPLLNVTDIDGLSIDNIKEGELLPSSFDESLISHVDKLSSESTTSSSSSCRGACSGLCVGTCGNTCNGCSGSCGGVCEGSCSSSCGSGCSSGCTGSRSGCGGSCNGCSGGCSGC